MGAGRPAGATPTGSGNAWQRHPGEKTRASINGERIRVQHGIPLSHNGMGALHIIIFIIINRTEPLSYYFAV